MCMHVHVCMCMCVGHPQPPHTLIHPPPTIQSHRKPKTPKFNNSWTNQDISILFEDSLPLNTPELIYTIVGHPRYPPPTCPTPQNWGNQNQKNHNKYWRNQYRLGLMCRSGVVLSQMALLCFGPKKVHHFCSRDPPIKFFPVLHWIPLDHI